MFFTSRHAKSRAVLPSTDSSERMFASAPRPSSDLTHSAWPYIDSMIDSMINGSLQGEQPQSAYADST